MKTVNFVLLSGTVESIWIEENENYGNFVIKEIKQKIVVLGNIQLERLKKLKVNDVVLVRGEIENNIINAIEIDRLKKESD